MKIHLSLIDEEQRIHELSLKVSDLSRLVAECGEQTGELTARIGLRQRGGNVEAKGSLKTTIQVPCHRCLDPVPLELEEAIEVTLAPEQLLDDMAEERNLTAGELDVSFFHGEQIDLAELVEEEILLLIPESVCEEDEQGRCERCGKNIDELYQSADDEKTDHPFSKMKDLIKT